MSKKALVSGLAVALLVLRPNVSLAEEWDRSLPQALDLLAENHHQPSVLTAFGTFTYAYTGLASPFSRWLEDELSMAMTTTTRLRLFNRGAGLLKDPAFKKLYEDFFLKNGVEGSLDGRFFDEGGRVRVRLELTSLSLGILVGASDLSLPLSAVPPQIALKPIESDMEKAASITAILSAEPQPARKAGALTVSVSTERGNGAVYREGEEMVVLVTVNKAAFIKIYHIDRDGIVQLIFPNKYESQNQILPGTEVIIPRPGDTFTFRMRSPFGTDFIKVVASTLPYTATEPYMTSLGTDARGIITRGLTVLPAPSSAGTESGAAAEMAEAMASYIVVEASRATIK